METSLQVTLTQTRHGEPLAVVDGFPGGGAELTPAQMRALAGVLIAAAEDCETAATRRRPRKGSLPAVSIYLTA